MSIDAILNQSEPNVILTAHATKVNRTEPNWTELQTCLTCRNHAFTFVISFYVTNCVLSVFNKENDDDDDDDDVFIQTPVH